MLFTELPLDPRVQRGINDAGFVTCTPVQAQTLPLAISGRDVAVQSQTGTGKTAAFVVSILQAMAEGRARRALVVVPTRELATQVEGDARQLAAHLSITTVAVYGGVAYDKQERLLRQGAELVVGTPGRILDFASKKILKLNEVDVAVIDEADRLFDMGFYYDIFRILRGMPSRGRQTMLFSATLDTKVRRLASEFMSDPGQVSIEPERKTVGEVAQTLFHVGSHEKVPFLLGILHTRAPKSVLIFTNTKIAAEDLAKRLSHNGLNCYALTGDLPQAKREKTLEAVKAGLVSHLVATDVAARGLHIEDLEMVVNYDLPEDPENYVHRIGRTARAGRKGVALTLACERYVQGLEAIEKYIGMRVPVGEVDESLMKPDRIAGRSTRHMHLPALPTMPRSHAQPQPVVHKQDAGTGSSYRKRHSQDRPRPARAPAASHVTPSPAETYHTHAPERRRHSLFQRILRVLKGK